ncbi:MAG: hypothetical protein B7Y84_09560 [Azorhizobium sp. 32-67-21]|jgi:hypothetical protein|nr:MAG: hypothetical protein B7Y84_09560 [Azorhizobium sp. 32-67-21]OYY13427.1 MAG: hypothetical protein B7Y70_02190 [Rhizobiales bacterium 35-68-8]
MRDLIARLQTKLGISEDAARRAIEVVVGFISHEAPAGALDELDAAIPGLKVLAETLPDDATIPAGSRHFGGMARLMMLADRMMAAGMTMPQVQDATREIIAYARERAGAPLVERIVAAIPGLRQVA